MMFQVRFKKYFYKSFVKILKSLDLRDTDSGRTVNISKIPKYCTLQYISKEAKIKLCLEISH